MSPVIVAYLRDYVFRRLPLRQAFIHRFGSSLNGHVHFHVCVVDETAVAQVQTDFRRRILRAFAGRGLRESDSCG